MANWHWCCSAHSTDSVVFATTYTTCKYILDAVSSLNNKKKSSPLNEVRMVNERTSITSRRVAVLLCVCYVVAAAVETAEENKSNVAADAVRVVP